MGRRGGIRNSGDRRAANVQDVDAVALEHMSVYF